MSLLLCDNGITGAGHMDKSVTVESLFEGYGLTELQISTILKLFESYLVDNRIVKGDALFEVCPKCGKRFIP